MMIHGHNPELMTWIPPLSSHASVRQDSGNSGGGLGFPGALYMASDMWKVKSQSPVPFALHLQDPCSELQAGDRRVRSVIPKILFARGCQRLDEAKSCASDPRLGLHVLSCPI